MIQMLTKGRVDSCFLPRPDFSPSENWPEVSPTMQGLCNGLSVTAV